MKSIIYTYRAWLLTALIACLFVACSPDDEDLKLKKLPADAAFTISKIDGMVNTYLLEAQVEAAAYQWDTGFGFQGGDKVDTTYFPQAGTYVIKMNAFVQGGMVTAENTVTVAENDPDAGCFGDALALLTGCGESQTWVLAGAGSLLVAPAEGSDVWWSISAGDAETRSCVMNDEYTFFSDGTFVFDSKGDVWVENDSPLGLGSGDACADWADLDEVYQPWRGGTHTFEIDGSDLTVNGLGAFLGIYKVFNTDLDEGTPVPVESVKYEIVELTAKKLVVKLVYNGGGNKWQFTFKPLGSTDPIEGTNILAGGDMEDESAWNINGTGSTTDTDYEFKDGALLLSNGDNAQSNLAIWQAVELEGGKTYQFSSYVKGSGMSNAWFEVYILDEEPQDGVDYGDGDAFATKLAGLHTWTGCGVDPFDGKLPDLSCIGNGQIDIEDDGTYYLFMKAGSWDGSLGVDGLTLDDVKFAELIY